MSAAFFAAAAFSIAAASAAVALSLSPCFASISAAFACAFAFAASAFASASAFAFASRGSAAIFALASASAFALARAIILGSHPSQAKQKHTATEATEPRPGAHRKRNQPSSRAVNSAAIPYKVALAPAPRE